MKKIRVKIKNKNAPKEAFLYFVGVQGFEP